MPTYILSIILAFLQLLRIVVVLVVVVLVAVVVVVAPKLNYLRRLWCS